LCVVELSTSQGVDLTSQAPSHSRRYDDFPAVVRFLIWTGAVIVAIPLAAIAWWFFFGLFIDLLIRYGF
jgi:hypothetical protein